MEAGQLWRQYIIAGIACFANILFGYCLGWTSPVIPKLANVTTSPLEHVLTTDQESLVGFFLPVGGVIGSFIGGFVAAILGRKWGLLSCSIPMITGWILITLASNVAMIYAGRFFWGLAIGIMLCITPIYCAEIATDNSRGVLGSFLQMFSSIGFLLMYSMGPYLDYAILGYVGIIISVNFVVLFYFMPESPMYYLTKGDVDSATKSLCKIRGRSPEAVQSEIAKMTVAVKTSTKKKAKITALFQRGNFKAFYISWGMIFLSQLCGSHAIMYYMSKIFDAAGSGLDSSISAIIVGAVQVAASTAIPLVVERLRRRSLMLLSACGTGLSNGLLGMYFYLADEGYSIVDSMSFLPVLSLMLFIVSHCWGLGILPWVIMAELLPMDVKEIAAPIAAATCWTMTILITGSFNIVVGAIGIGSTFFIFSASCSILFFFTLFLVPETKGKSFQEIRDMLDGPKIEKS